MKAIINGAGIAGLAAAKFLGDQGWDVLVLEIAPKRRMAGYIVDFFGPGYDAAEAAGLRDALFERRCRVDQIKNVRESDRVRSRMNYKLFADSMGGRMFSILRGDIEDVLFQTLPKNVNIRFGTTIKEVINLDGQVKVVLNSGVTETADLLIGADGIHSHLRELVFGPEEQFLHYLNFHTAAFIFDDPEVVEKVGDDFRMLSLPNRQVALYQLDNGRLATFFAHRADEAIRPKNPAEELRHIYGDLGWHVPAILDAADECDDIYYDWLAQIEMPTWTKGRAVMIGDAGYAVSLLAGQGASLAVAGAWELAQSLKGGDIDGGLAKFEAALKTDIAKKQVSGRKAANWIVPPTRFHNGIRDIVLNATNLPGLSHIMRFFFAPSLKSFSRR